MLLVGGFALLILTRNKHNEIAEVSPVIAPLPTQQPPVASRQGKVSYQNGDTNFLAYEGELIYCFIGDWNQQDANTVRQAWVIWAQSTGISFLEVQGNDPLCQDEMIAYDETIDYFGADTYAMKAWASIGIGYIMFNSKAYPVTLTVSLHEIGHNLGLPHSPDKNNIMYEFDAGITALDTASVFTVVQNWRIGEQYE